MEKFEKLFSPIQVGPFTLKNRIVYSPAATLFAGASGEVNRLMLDYYSRIARGGAAMVTVEASVVEYPRGLLTKAMVRIDKDRFIPGLNKLAETIQRNGAVAVAQIAHAGRFAKVDDPVAPSDIPGLDMEGKMTSKIRPLSTTEAEELVEKFAQAALRAKQAGFDIVNIHGGTSYLIQGFYSPRLNKRTDKYGGSFQNRIRFPLEVIARIKEVCGEDYPLSFTLIVDELLPDGFQLEEGKAFARELEKAGIVYIVTRAGTYESMCLGEGILAMRSPAGITLPKTEAIKKEVNIPVTCFAKIHDPVFMEKILQEGRADLIHTARALIADSELPKKAKEGRLEDIRRCLSCFACHDRLNKSQYVGCAINPEMGLEDAECKLEKVSQPKKVVIVGGGPAGLEAAMVASLRGHKVALFEREKELGGQLKFAALGLGKEAYKTNVIDWLERQCRKAGAEIMLNKEVTLSTIEELKPDVVIIATGAIFSRPPISGVNGKNVIDFWDVFMRKVDLAGKDVVVIGGAAIGAETADLLAETGSKVTVIMQESELAEDMAFADRAYLLNKLEEYNVVVKPNRNVEEIKEEGVIASDKKWNKELIKADKVVVAVGGSSDKNLVETLNDKVLELYIIGDAKEPRKLYQAIHEGFHVARQI